MRTLWGRLGPGQVPAFTRVTLDSTKPLHRLQLYVLACALYEQQVNFDFDLDLEETGKKVPIRKVLDLLGILVAKKTGKPGVLQLLFPPILRKHFLQGFQFSGLPLLRLLLSHSAPGLVDQGTLLEYGIHEKFLVRLGALIPGCHASLGGTSPTKSCPPSG